MSTQKLLGNTVFTDMICYGYLDDIMLDLVRLGPKSTGTLVRGQDTERHTEKATWSWRRDWSDAAVGQRTWGLLAAPESWRIPSSVTSVCFKSTWYLTEMFCSYALRALQWSTAPIGLRLDHRNVPAQMRPGLVWKFSLLPCYAKLSAQGSDLYSARHNSRHKEAQKTVHAPACIYGKTIALTRRTFVGKVMSLLFNMLSRLVITFLH